MKFRKLLLCLFAGIFMTAFANLYTYAAEDDTIVTEEANITNSTIDNTEETDNSKTTEDTTDTSIDEAAQKAAEEKAAAEKAAAEKAAEEKAAAEKAAEEKAAKEKAAKEKAAKEKAAKEKAAKEKAAKEKAAKEKAAAEKAAKEKEESYSKEDLRLLSAIIYCEAAGESYNGKLAVGIVVMNRVRSGRFPGSVKKVIYQKSQFGPVNNGSLNRALSDYDNGRFTSEREKACIKAAKEALSGETNITVSGKTVDFSKYLFFSGRIKGATYSFGNHDFK